MKTTTKRVTVYEASDGKEFLSLTDCQQYEKYLREMDEIEYFVVHHSPDLNETGCFTEKTAVAVNKHRHLGAETIVNAWAIGRFGYIGVSVQGYGLQRYYSVLRISRGDYFSPKYDDGRSERIFISQKDVEGFPPKTDMMSVWLKQYERR